MPKAPKPAPPSFHTWAEIDAAGLELLQLDAQIVGAGTALEEKIAAVKEKYKELIQAPSLQRDLLLTGIENFVVAHRSEFDGQSRVLTHCVVGFHKRPPAVVKVMDTWDAVVTRLISLGKRAEGYLRRKVELDKQAILKAWSQHELSAKKLAELGVAVDDTSEDFYCEALSATVAVVN